MIIVCAVAGVRMQHSKTTGWKQEKKSNGRRRQVAGGSVSLSLPLSLSLIASPTIVNCELRCVAYVIVMQVSLKCIAAMPVFFCLSVHRERTLRCGRPFDIFQIVCVCVTSSGNDGTMVMMTNKMRVHDRRLSSLLAAATHFFFARLLLCVHIAAACTLCNVHVPQLKTLSSCFKNVHIALGCRRRRSSLVFFFKSSPIAAQIKN